MDRRSLSIRWTAIVLSLSLVLMASGCKSALQSLTILYEGYDIPAEFDGLQGKTVAVVCKPLTELDFSNSDAARALTEGICERLKKHVKDIHIIDPEKIAKLRDEKAMDDYLEIGKTLKADKVVGINIESFGVLDGQTLFRGRSTLSIRVYDVAEKTTEWHKSPPAFTYPKVGPTPAADIAEAEFRNEFVASLAEQIARLFYPHDRHDDYCDETASTH